MAIWAAGTFLLIAFAPVSLSGGYQPYPLFHGRHILPACIPFALCLASVVGHYASKIARAREVSAWAFRLWPAAVVLVMLAGVAGLRDLRGFRDRPTGRVGDAIDRMIPATVWDITKTIYMTPSAYWRYRILFPEHLRSRLRVAVADGAPDWWRSITPDITERCLPLPDPRDAYLLVTPTQLEGSAESWDYGVTLPPAQLAAWPRDFWRGVLRDKSVVSSVLPPTNPHDIVALLIGVPFPVATRDETAAHP